MITSLQLQVTGVGLLALSLLHLAFPKRFDWPQELARLSLLNRQIFLVHTLFIMVVVALMGIVMTWAPETLLERSKLGVWVAAGFTLFWGLRLVIQWFGYSRRLWWGKPLETAVHCLFTLAWGWLTWLGLGLWQMQLN
jgi:hypothetical protein